MTDLIAFMLYGLTVALGLLMLAQGLSGKVDLISVRNFFLLGFIVFQLTSAAVTLQTEQYPEFPLHDPVGTGFTYFFMVCVFLVVFLFAYGRGWVVKKLARVTPVGEAAPGPTSMLTLALVFVGIGMVFQLVLIRVPILGKLTGIMGAGVLAVAAGMAAWAYVPRLLNPAIAAISGVVVLLALGTTLHQAFGRRDVLSVTLGIIWGAYHGYWKRLPTSQAFLRLGAVGAAGLMFLALFTAVRSGGERERSATETMQLMTGATGQIKDGIVDVLSGQLAGLNSMWLIENYPERFRFVPMHSLVYFFVQPVPRDLWPGKPDALGRRAVKQANAGEGKDDNWSIGPGIIGHIAADNPWLSLIPYALLLGLLIRYMDELVRVNAYNPFVVLPIGTALGQVLGWPRGELGLFVFQASAGIIAAWVMMFVVARTMSLMGWRMVYADDVEHDHGGDGDDWTDWDEPYDSGSSGGGEPAPEPASAGSRG